MKRYFSLDILRIVSILMVILLHVLAYPLVTLSINSFDWWLSNIIIAFTRGCVPLFFMLSGAFIVDKYLKEGWLVFITKRVFRLLTALIFWSIVGYIYLVIIRHKQIDFLPVFLSGFWRGRGIFYHSYFLYILIEVYLLVPLSTRLVGSQSKVGLLIALLILATSAIDLIIISLGGRGMGLVGLPGKGTLFIPFWGYFLLGYYLMKRKVIVRGWFLLLIFSSCSVLVAFFSYIQVLNSSFFRDVFFSSSYFSPLVVMAAVSLFIYFKNANFRMSSLCIKYLKEAIPVAMGIYLVHPIILDLISSSRPGIYLFGYQLPAIIAFTITFLVVFLASFGLSSLIRNKLGSLSRFIV